MTEEQEHYLGVL